MTEALLFYCLAIWFVFYVVNHSDLLAKPRSWIMPKLPWWLEYSVSCAICSTFWTSIVMFFVGVIPLIFVFVAPPVVLGMNLAFLRLKPNA